MKIVAYPWNKMVIDVSSYRVWLRGQNTSMYLRHIFIANAWNKYSKLLGRSGAGNRTFSILL